MCEAPLSVQNGPTQPGNKHENQILASSTGTVYSYDLLGRVTQVDFPDGGRTTDAYTDVPPVSVLETTKITSSLNRQVKTIFDGLGRVSMVGTSNGTSKDWVRTEYDGKGRVSRTSNPVTRTTDPTGSGNFNGWTTYTYDNLDRVTQTQMQDGQLYTNQYSGDTTTVTDPVGIYRINTVDALGRLTQVNEGGLYSTTYGYDVLDNLTQVSQPPQTRTFTYDSLSRLRTAANPESGTTTYTYDNNSNLSTRADARNVTATYAYDSLDRNTTTTYSDGTPTVTYTYDSGSVTNGKGRRTGMSDGAGSSTFHYDVMGRTSKIIRAMTGGPLPLTGEFVYNLTGGVLESRWPGILDGSTPLTIYYAYDTQGQQKQSYWSNGGSAYQALVDNYTFNYTNTSATNYAQEMTDFGNNTIETITYDLRLQPVNRLVTNPSPVLNLAYSFKRTGDNKNNGNVFAIADDVNADRSQTFTYDGLNRLHSYASNEYGSMDFVYDDYGPGLNYGLGNRSKQIGYDGAPTMNLAISATTNRITTSGYNSYDAAGNQQGIPGKTFQYDGESRIKTVNSGSAGTYTYDGDGRRAKKVAGGETRYFFYDALGAPVWEYVPGIGYETFNFQFNGRHLATNNTTNLLLFRHLDHLGSPRLLTTSNGSVHCNMLFHPFGEEALPCAAGDKRRFTGKERDAESSLDYFGARYYGSLLGRFTTPDPGPVKRNDPQIWNRYSYVRNNPINYVDPNGEILELPSDPKERQRLLSVISSGLRKADRSHVKAVLGTGKNGLLKGRYYLDARSLNSRVSKDLNYNALRQIANSPGYAKIRAVDQQAQISYSLSNSRAIGTTSFGQLNQGVSQADLDLGRGVAGLTLSPASSLSLADQGSPTSPEPGVSLVYINDAVENPETFCVTVAHELYGHLLPAFLGEGRQTSHKQVGDQFDQTIATIEKRTIQNYEEP